MHDLLKVAIKYFFITTLAKKTQILSSSPNTGLFFQTQNENFHSQIGRFDNLLIIRRFDIKNIIFRKRLIIKLLIFEKICTKFLHISSVVELITIWVQINWLNLIYMNLYNFRLVYMIWLWKIWIKSRSHAARMLKLCTDSRLQYIVIWRGGDCEGICMPMWMKRSKNKDFKLLF